MSMRFGTTCLKKRVRFNLRRYPCATDAGPQEAGVAFPSMPEAAVPELPAARGAESATTTNTLADSTAQI
jgi:hypothetical protein